MEPLVHVLMKAEGRPANAAGYYAMPLDATLRDALANKRIIEFPTLIVLLAGDDEAEYTILPPTEAPDDDDDDESESGAHMCTVCAAARSHTRLQTRPARARRAMHREESAVSLWFNQSYHHHHCHHCQWILVSMALTSA